MYENLKKSKKIKEQLGGIPKAYSTLSETEHELSP